MGRARAGPLEKRDVPQGLKFEAFLLVPAVRRSAAGTDLDLCDLLLPWHGGGKEGGDAPSHAPQAATPPSPESQRAANH